MNARRASVSILAAFLLAAAPASAREVLTPEEQAERELEKKRAARPALQCTPVSLSFQVKEGETPIFLLTIRNGGGRTLRWSVTSVPSWVRLDRMSGKLGFEEEEELVLVADPEGRPAGTARGKIVLAAPDAEGSPVTVAVALEIPDVRPPPEEKLAAGPREPAPERPEREPPEQRPPEPIPVVRKAKGRRWGIQGGLLQALPGVDQGLGGAPFGTLFLRFGAEDAGSRGEPARRMGLDLGFGYGRMTRREPYPAMDMLLGRARALFPAGGGGLYVTAGAQVIMDNGNPDNGEFPDNTGVTLDVGAMLRLANRLELGASYSMLLASENVPGMLEFSVGVTF